MAEQRSTIHIDLVAVDARIWSGEASVVSATTTEGDIGVLPGHAPLLGALAPDSVVRIATAEGERAYRVAGGYLSVTDEGVSLPVESAELLEPVRGR